MTKISAAQRVNINWAVRASWYMTTESADSTLKLMYIRSNKIVGIKTRMQIGLNWYLNKLSRRPKNSLKFLQRWLSRSLQWQNEKIEVKVYILIPETPHPAPLFAPSPSQQPHPCSGTSAARLTSSWKETGGHAFPSRRRCHPVKQENIEVPSQPCWEAHQTLTSEDTQLTISSEKSLP